MDTNLSSVTRYHSFSYYNKTLQPNEEKVTFAYSAKSFRSCFTKTYSKYLNWECEKMKDIDTYFKEDLIKNQGDISDISQQVANNDNYSYLDIIMSSDSDDEESKKAKVENPLLSIYEVTYKNSIASVILTQIGSRKLQKLIDRNQFNKKDLLSIYDEIKDEFNSLLIHKYANYFCQQLFMKLPQCMKNIILHKIIKELPSLASGNKNVCSIVVLFEKHLIIQDQQEVVNAIIPLMNSYSSNYKIIRIFEAIIGKFDQNINKPVKDYIIKNMI